MAKLEFEDSYQYGSLIQELTPDLPDYNTQPTIYKTTHGWWAETVYFDSVDDARLYAMEYHARRTWDQHSIRAMSILKWEPSNINHGHIASCSERIDITCNGSCDGCPCHIGLETT